MLKVSAFYLEKQTSFIPKKKILGRTAKIHPKDGVSRLNFPEGFEGNLIKLRNVLWLRFLLFDKDKKKTRTLFFLPCTHTYTHVKVTQPKKWAEIRMLRHLCRLDGSSQWV